MNIVIGKTYQMKTFNVTLNEFTLADATITDYVKRPGQKDIVEFDIVKYGMTIPCHLAVNVFKSKCSK